MQRILLFQTARSPKLFNLHVFPRSSDTQQASQTLLRPGRTDGQDRRTGQTDIQTDRHSWEFEGVLFPPRTASPGSLRLSGSRQFPVVCAQAGYIAPTSCAQRPWGSTQSARIWGRTRSPAGGQGEAATQLLAPSEPGESLGTIGFCTSTEPSPPSGGSPGALQGALARLQVRPPTRSSPGCAQPALSSRLSSSTLPSVWRQH